nr:MAG TPA: hypothetical protein [Caudoviricetes sp.]
MLQVIVQNRWRDLLNRLILLQKNLVLLQLLIQMLH